MAFLNTVCGGCTRVPGKLVGVQNATGAKVQLRGNALPVKQLVGKHSGSATVVRAMAMPASGVRQVRLVQRTASEGVGTSSRGMVKGLPPLENTGRRYSTVMRAMAGNPSRGQQEGRAPDGGLVNAIQNFFSTGDETEGKPGGRPNPMQWGNLLKVTARFAFLVFIIPGAVAQSVKAVLIMPWMKVHHDDGKSIVLTPAHEDHVAHKLEEYEKELRFHLLLEQHQKGLPPTPAKEYEAMIKKKADYYTEHAKEERLQARANVMGTAVLAVMTITMITTQYRNVTYLLGAIQDEFIKLDSATQAFFLLLVADIAVGYHSSDGWQAILHCVANHYGVDYHKCELGVRIFVATVPVCLDICFKWWVFVRLRKMSPSTQILLGDIERH